MTCAVSKRNACVSNSCFVVQMNMDIPYKTSIDQYGMIVHGMNGTFRSHSKTQEPTWECIVASQLAAP